MRERLRETTREALVSVMPITGIVFALSVLISPMPVGTLALFIFGAILLILGMGFFTMGADMVLLPMGEDIGITMTFTKKLFLVIVTCFIMGVIITIAEPDLQVLAQLVPDIPNFALIIVVACGVGIFLVLSIIRILFRINLARLLVICYGVVIVTSIFAPANFVAVAFDSGGVTTGPITVPFILAMGLGLASIRGDKESKEDSFGLVALCSIGPILAVLILSICFKPSGNSYSPPVIPVILTSRDVTLEFIKNTPHHFLEVAKSVWPILAVLFVFQLITKRYRKRQMFRLLIGFIYVFAGLVLFLTGVNVGFIPVGQSIGADIANTDLKWLLIPIGAIIGYFIVAAEPAVHVLRKQVEEVSGGAIPGSAVQKYLSVGVSFSLALSMLRVITGISLFLFLIPGYIIAIALTFYVPKIFTGVAFDSGGVVTGPMTSSFLLPFAIGACTNPERIMMDAFGLVAMVAMAPLIAIQLMGFIYKNKMTMAKAIEVPDIVQDIEEDDIVEFEEVIEDDYDGQQDAE